MQKPLLLVLFCFGPGLASGQASSTEAASQKFLYHIDPIGLAIIEPIERGMTLYGLARKYNVGIDSMLAANPDLNPQAIPLGYPVNIPIYPKAITILAPKQGEEAIPVYYRVQPKETLYRISRVYLGVSPETVIALNPRASTQLSIGEVLHLGWYRPYENTYSPVVAASTSAMDSTMYKVKDYSTEYRKEGKVIREQKGLAVWKPGNDKSHYFVLHPTAQVGSYMEVTNPMLHRTLTAKVSGNIPPGIYQSRVGLVVSPSVARALGVLDQQFFAKWRFVE